MLYLIEEQCFQSLHQSHHIVVIEQVAHIFILSYIIFAVKVARGSSIEMLDAGSKNTVTELAWEVHFEERPPEAERKKLKIL